MSKKIQEIISNAEIIQRSFTEPTSIVVTDREQYLLHLPAAFDTAHIPAGTLVADMTNPLMQQALKTGETIRTEVGPERFLVPFSAVWNPISENNEIAGLLITTTSTEKLDTLRKMSSELAAAAEQMAATTDQVLVSQM
ncbi:hypothetical protein [Peribacillus sp. SCS-37]|uniref:hypothetical protein n=1 Tax=Paraperibacillus esterisolvens TaxID=3115296 RepID=UPI003905AA71